MTIREQGDMNAKKKPTRPDWVAVEEIIRRSVRGRGVSDTDRQIIHDAYTAEPEHYSELSRRVRREEQEAFRRSGGVG